MTNLQILATLPFFAAFIAAAIVLVTELSRPIVPYSRGDWL